MFLEDDIFVSPGGVREDIHPRAFQESLGVDEVLLPPPPPKLNELIA